MPTETKRGMLFAPGEVEKYRDQAEQATEGVIEAVSAGALLALSSLAKENPVISAALSIAALALLFDGGRRYGRADTLATLFGEQKDEE